MHRKACNHPELLKKDLPELFTKAKAGALKDSIPIPKAGDYTCSGKLLGLVEVLQQTEIISSSEVSGEETKANSATVETSLADYAATSMT